MRAWLAGVCVHSGTQAVRSAVGHAFQGHQRIHGRNVRQHRQVPTGTHQFSQVVVALHTAPPSSCRDWTTVRQSSQVRPWTVTTAVLAPRSRQSAVPSHVSHGATMSVELKYLVDCCDVDTRQHLRYHLIMPHIRSSGHTTRRAVWLIVKVSIVHQIL